MLTMSFKVFLAVYCFGVLFNFSNSERQDDGIKILLKNREIPNHGLVIAQDIGVNPWNKDNLAVGLSCNTTYDGCCSDSAGVNHRQMSANGKAQGGLQPSGIGSWLYPSLPLYPYVRRQVDGPGHNYGIRRQENAVYLFRSLEETNSERYALSVHDGIWRCVIPDSRGIQQTKYIGIYSNRTNKGSLSVVVPGPGMGSTIEFSVMTEEPLMFSLTLRTTGGPATYVTWTRDGVNISSLSNSHFETLQTVQSHGPNNNNYITGDYTNVLRVSGRLPGEYGVSVTNDRTQAPVTSNVSVLDFVQYYPNASAHIMRSENFKHISMSWSLMDPLILSLPMGVVIAYELRYTKCILTENCEDILESVNVTKPDSEISITNVSLWTTYHFTITVTAHFNLSLINGNSKIHALPGYRPVTVVNTSTVITTTGVLAPVTFSVTELPNVTSVHVFWNQPAGGLPIDRYVVSYGQQRQSDNETDGNSTAQSQDRGNITITNDSSTTVLHLQASKTYVVTVTAWTGALYNTSAQFQFVTNSTRVEKSSTAITAPVTVVVVLTIVFVAVIVLGLLMYRYHWSLCQIGEREKNFLPGRAFTSQAQEMDVVHVYETVDNFQASDVQCHTAEDREYNHINESDDQVVTDTVTSTRGIKMSENEAYGHTISPSETCTGEGIYYVI